MTPETLAAILCRAGVGTWHNSVGPHHETHLEEARALLREPEFVALRKAAEDVVDALGFWEDSWGRPRVSYPTDVDGDSDPETDGIFVRLRAALQAGPARAEEGAS